MSDIILTDQNFEEEVLKSTIPVLVDFWAPWCGPCKMVGPIVESVAKDFSGKAKVGKLNVDENPQIASKYSVMSIPTLMVFNRGKSNKTMVGVQSKDTLTKVLNDALAE